MRTRNPSTARALVAATTVVLLTFSCLARAADPPPAAPPASLNDAISLVPEEYRHKLVQQLSLAEDNRQQWLDAIVRAKPEQREAVAFLLVNMPDRDLPTLKADFLLRNVEGAYEAKAKAPWADSVPQEIFFDAVLPYANLNERRDDWRADFNKRFFPLVKDCKTPGEAAQVLNRQAFKAVDVKYHATKRPKPDQSPFESIDAHFASCSGLSILLVDACRAVGVPARTAGTPLWADKSGNHTWTEVWDGKQWRFVGAAEPGEFDKTWFAGLAAKADDAKPEHRIYAASFRRTDLPFLLVWDPESKDYSAVDVTGYYVARKALKVTVAGGGEGTAVEVRQGGRLVGRSTGATAAFDLAAGAEYAVRAVGADGKKAEKDVKLPKDADTTVELKLAAE